MTSRFVRTFAVAGFAFTLTGLVAAGCASRAEHAVALYDTGDYAGAAHAADEGLAAHPGDDDLWAMRIRAALALGDANGVATAWAKYHEARGGDDRELLGDLAIATLDQALLSPSVRLKISAIHAVADAKLEALADHVARQMENPDERVSATAAIAVLHSYAQTQEVVDNALRSDDPDARWIAIEGLGVKVGKYAFADFEKAANDRNVRVRATAVRWIGQLDDPNGGAILEKRAKDPEEDVRAAAMTALAKTRHGDLAGFAKAALADHAQIVRLAAIDLLVAAKQPDTDAALVALTDDSNDVLALQAAVALHGKNPAAAAHALDRAAHAAERETCAGAANLATAAVGKEAAAPVEHTLLADPDASVRLAAARAVVRTSRAEALAVFAAALDDPKVGVQAAADLAANGDARGRDALDHAVRDLGATPDAREEAAAAHRTAHVVTPGLLAALADPSPVVRVEAATVLAFASKGAE